VANRSGQQRSGNAGTVNETRVVFCALFVGGAFMPDALRHVIEKHRA
jgi:hypothetical protein